MTPTLSTADLTLREFTPEDAPFILRLVNEPLFLRFIGDRGVRTLDQARSYLCDGPIKSYALHGHGLLHVARRDHTPIGMCGLLRRDTLDAPDLGFAFVPEAHGRGYARQAAIAVLRDAEERLGITRVLAITSVDNAASVRLLLTLGFAESGRIRHGAALEELRAFEWRFEAGPPRGP